MTDIEIARKCKLKKITEVAAKIGIDESRLELYGNYKAKVTAKPSPKSNAKLVLVTAINPTSAGEGKTTVSIGLADGMNLVGAKTCLALREPSLGPVFGIKGGATGGGYSQILPMEDINLHFTGDFHAITAANNLLCAMLDNSIFQGNKLNINPDNIRFNRTLDVNDRALRGVEVNSGVKDAISHHEKFNITAACEVMAVLTLAEDLDDLKRRLGNILVAYDYDGNPVFARDLHAENAMTILLKDALKPNLVQTIGGTPAFVHCGPFANIAHGCNSVQATKLAMTYADYTVTEAGFGADLGAEKFLDVKCRLSGLKPNAVVVVATVRALKLHGGSQNDLTQEDLPALKKGMCNLVRHVKNIRDVYRLPVVVAVNRFTSDTEKEIAEITGAMQEMGVHAVTCDVWGKGGEGATELAKAVRRLCDDGDNSQFTFCYDDSDGVEEKIRKVAQKIYGAKDVELLPKAQESLRLLAPLGIGNMPVVIAKTQYSFSDDASLLGAPEGFTVKIRDIEYRGGAGFLVALAGNMLLMPGLSKTPNAVNMTIDSNGKIDGLY
ncbi:MAG TPA: formate--tetrahydrofolate ligase [Candidatus Fimimonas merdipullorum]|uniref:Formate--tetrahydrofolate ligase n=1 Tax=Candidatus Fimimonas merdipullorum TaxID=2840822 RepID=A0A9D1MX50_9BACT|nr:formate--tetrahydrofolate ligase [Candidatus Fimimonas merdipullorum]